MATPLLVATHYSNSDVPANDSLVRPGIPPEGDNRKTPV